MGRGCPLVEEKEIVTESFPDAIYCLPNLVTHALARSLVHFIARLGCGVGGGWSQQVKASWSIVSEKKSLYEVILLLLNTWTIEKRLPLFERSHRSAHCNGRREQLL